ncbi:endonuclease [Bacteriovoracaceae bacterium]|nr:endonuclease [Bacteriovoracaceae bacterium]
MIARLLCIVSIAFFTTATLAKGNYYGQEVRRELTKGSLQNESLLSLLKRVSSKNFKPLGYKRGTKKEIFGYVDLKRGKAGLFIHDVYCGFDIRVSASNTRPKNEVMNVEHTWPQSKGAKREPARGDIHHLFPTDSRANSARGNYPFGEVNGGDATDRCDLSKSGRIIDPETGRTSGQRGFEVPENHKGNTARAMFYVVAKYGYKLGRLEEYYLRKWHKEDPVDREEVLRNDRIQDVQGNRNPFIDFPGLADRISDL